MSDTFPPATIHREDKWFVAECPATGVISQGKTVADALKNLKEASGLYLEEFPQNKFDQSTPTSTFQESE